MTHTEAPSREVEDGRALGLDARAGRVARDRGCAQRSAVRANMQDLTERPLVCVTLASAAGIGLAGAYGMTAVWVAGGLGLVGLAGCAWRRSRAWSGLVVLAAVGAAGSAVFLLAGVRPATDVSALPTGGQTLVGTVAGAPRYADGMWRFVLDVESHEGSLERQAVGGRAYVRLRSSEPVERGQRWRLTGKLRGLRDATNPGGRSEAARLGSLGVTAVLTVGAEELAESLGQGRMGPISAHAFRAQRRALGMLEQHVSGPYRELSAAVAGSVIFGVHAAPPPAEITEVFRRAGTIHLLVVSGAMVSMVFGMVLLPGALGAGWRRMRTERQFGWPVSGRGRIRLYPGLGAAVVGMVVVTYYAVLTEGGQAVARAAIMGVLVGLAFALRRVPAVAREHGLNVDRYTLLAAAALGILAVKPTSLFQPGFQLSFAAVWAIIYLTPKAAPFVRWLPRWIGWTAVATVAAQLATFPILAWHYGQAPIAGFGANLLAVPLAAVVLVGGMVTCGLGVVAPWLAPIAGWVTGMAARWMVWVSGAFGSLPWASVEVARPGIVVVVIWYAGMVALGWGVGRLGAGHPEE